MENEVLDRVVERSVSRRRATSEDEVRRLVDAGIAVMRDRTSIDPRVTDIVRAAGLSNQAFYRHFRSKDELLLAVLAEGRRQLLDFLVRTMGGEATPEGKVRRWVEGVMAQALNPEAAAATRPFAVNANRLAHEFPEETARSADALKAPLLEPLAALGSADAERDADAVYHLVMGRMERHLTAGTAPRPADVEHLVAFVLRALRAPGAAA